MAGGEDDSAIRFSKEHGHFRGGSGCEAALYHIYSAADEGSHNKLLHHIARHTGILTNNNLVALTVGLGLALRQCGCICGREFHYIDRSERTAGFSANCSANTGNGFNECHIFWFLGSIYHTNILILRALNNSFNYERVLDCFDVGVFKRFHDVCMVRSPQAPGNEDFHRMASHPHHPLLLGNSLL